MNSLRLVSGLVLLLLGSASFAAEDMYPCNLSLKRPAKSYASPDQNLPNGQSNAGNSGGFNARAYIEDRSVDVSSPLRLRWVTVTAPSTGEWIQLFPASEEFQYSIRSVEFPQSIETLGVSYQVGFCYVGPVSTAATANDADNSQGRYDFIGTLSAGAEANSINYQGTANVSCDLRNAGTHQGARTAAEVFPGVIDRDLQFNLNLGRLSTGQMSFESSLNSQSNQVPRFCKINIQVDETSTGVRPSELNLSEAQITLQIDKNLR